MIQTVEVPVKLLQGLVEAERTLISISDELEDFLLAHDPKFLKKMHSARRAHRAGKTRSLKAFLTA